MWCTLRHSCTSCHTTPWAPKQTPWQGWHFRVSGLRNFQPPWPSKLSEDLAEGPSFRVAALSPSNRAGELRVQHSQHSPAQGVASLCLPLAEDKKVRIQSVLKGQGETDRQMIPKNLWSPFVHLPCHCAADFCRPPSSCPLCHPAPGKVTCSHQGAGSPTGRAEDRGIQVICGHRQVKLDTHSVS